MNIYSFIHIILGGMSNEYPEIIPVFGIYQFGQLYLNKRVFFFEREVLDGNSIPHTIKKIGEFVIGKVLLK